MIALQTAQGTTIIGDNQPDRFTLFREHLDELIEQAKQFLDGQPVETDAQAEDVSRLLNMIRKAANDADEARKDEKKPHDDAAKAVQAKWKPILETADLAVATCKKALAPFLQKKEDEQRAAAEAARMEAEKQAAAARKAAENASEADLAAQTTIRVLQENAADLEKKAARLEKGRAHATGGERAVGLRSVWTPTLVNPVEALKHYRATQPEGLKAWLLDQARQDVRAGKRSIPGFEIIETKEAR